MRAFPSFNGQSLTKPWRLDGHSGSLSTPCRLHEGPRRHSLATESSFEPSIAHGS